MSERACSYRGLVSRGTLFGAGWLAVTLLHQLGHAPRTLQHRADLELGMGLGKNHLICDAPSLLVPDRAPCTGRLIVSLHQCVHLAPLSTGSSALIGCALP
jgi:hypothetical protein